MTCCHTIVVLAFVSVKNKSTLISKLYGMDRRRNEKSPVQHTGRVCVILFWTDR